VNTRIVLHCLVPALLLAALMASAAAQNPPPDSKPQGTGEAAAAPNAQPVKKAKHVYTDDDFRSSRASSGSGSVDVSAMWSMDSQFPKDPVTAKDVAAAQKLVVPSYQFNLRQTKESVANLYLQQYKDAAFSGRSEWEDRLFTEFECTRSAQGEYVKELDSVSKDPEYRDLLVVTRFSDSDLRKIGELRTRLIADWNPVRVCEAKFDVIRKEGWQRADEWLKTHPPRTK
jgi:hypothetical protein